MTNEKEKLDFLRSEIDKLAEKEYPYLSNSKLVELSLLFENTFR